jgi:predicted metalloprotease
MRLDNQRESTNVERRRGGRSKAAMGGGVGAIVMALVAIFLFNEDPQKVLSQMGQGQSQQGDAKPLTPRQEAMDKFVRQIKGSTEDVWIKIFREAGSEYRIPKLVNYDGMTRMKTGGVADSRMGPFYLPAEETVYLDTSFFDQMDRELGGGGDFPYVIAHEVGHHIQKLTGKTDFVHSKKGRISEIEYNRLSVRLELQADFYAGVWAHHDNENYRREHGENRLEPGDVQEAMNSAKAIGDDTLQKNAGQRVQPETFNPWHFRTKNALV